MNTNIEECIDYFFGDANVLRLVASSASWEPLRICYPKEVNVSRFIAWLLDPTEGHGLGDLAIQSLLARAWWQSDEAELEIATRRFLSPANIYTEGFSASVVGTEIALGEKSLDVLILDTNRRRYIAIENKFGAAQSKKQLKSYRNHLEKLFPDFLGIHIFLDSNDAEPEDKAWIPVGYDWLADFLREAEKRESTAMHVRDTLSQFRSVIEDEAEDAMAKSTRGRLVTEVASGHPEIFALMNEWAAICSKGQRAAMLNKLLSDATTLEGKAKLRLFQLYWRRTVVWEECIRQAQFAPFVHTLRSRFDDLIVNPKRVRTAFSLENWVGLIDTEQFAEWYYPAGITVWRTGEKFRVVTFVQLNDVKAEKRNQLIEVAEDIRRANGIKGLLRDEQAFVMLRQRKELLLDRAIAETQSQMIELEAKIKPML
ncbi:PDDEXK-like family protein [Herbaspirillum huttiense]|uniref:PD-(D/E)XK nuclease family protein n=2 Tax=Herbaspirillum huttiense TaxID=863372 RepID=A0AAJ2H9P9_9BURK|nr:PD-(D/E)XK nuclease family protein [Herbaspirillum huttiense]MDR9839379.1 PD-(D/E)XK nuclease family protein [Herbaspirillum huttiense]